MCAGGRKPSQHTILMKIMWMDHPHTPKEATSLHYSNDCKSSTTGSCDIKYIQPQRPRHSVISNITTILYLLIFFYYYTYDCRSCFYPTQQSPFCEGVTIIVPPHPLHLHRHSQQQHPRRRRILHFPPYPVTVHSIPLLRGGADHSTPRPPPEEDSTDNVEAPPKATTTKTTSTTKSYTPILSQQPSLSSDDPKVRLPPPPNTVKTTATISTAPGTTDGSNSSNNDKLSAFLKVRSMTTTSTNDMKSSFTNDSSKNHNDEPNHHPWTKEQHPQQKPQQLSPSHQRPNTNSNHHHNTQLPLSETISATTTTTTTTPDENQPTANKESTTLTHIDTATITAITTNTKWDTMVRVTIHRLWNLLYRTIQYLVTMAIFGTTAVTTTTTSIISIPTLYLYALIGSSIGFYIYVYFISIGHALGIFVPVFMTLLRYIRYIQTVSWSMISFPSIFHSVLVLLWSIRLGTFLIWREYVSWYPALHNKIRQVQVPLLQKFIAWFVYSLYYVCLASPCYFRLQSNIILQQQQQLKLQLVPTSGRWMIRLIRSFVTYTGLLLQIIGLILETVADYQKSTYKSQYRNQISKSKGLQSPWCHVGVWKYSTHPNYVGEWLFWCGTILAALPSTFIHASFSVSNPPWQWHGMVHVMITTMKCSIMILGLYILSIILYGAANKLDIKQRAKYGNASSNATSTTTTTDHDNTAAVGLSFVEYQSTIGMFGPKRWWYSHRHRTGRNHEHRRDDSKRIISSSTTSITDDALLQQEPMPSTEALLDSTLAATEEETFR